MNSRGTINTKLDGLLASDNLDIESLKLPIAEAVNHYKYTVELLQNKEKKFGKIFDKIDNVSISKFTLESFLTGVVTMEDFINESKVSTDEIGEIVIGKDDHLDDMTLNDFILEQRSIKNNTTLEDEIEADFNENKKIDDINEKILELQSIGSKQLWELDNLNDTNKVYPSDIIFKAIQVLIERGENVNDIFKVDLIKDLGNDLYNIGDKIIYDYELNKFYKIVKILSDEKSFILEGLGEKSFNGILVGCQIYSLVEGSSNIYKLEVSKIPINPKSSENEICREKLVVIGDNYYKVENEYSKSPYLKLSKGKDLFIYNKLSGFLSKVDFIFDTCTFNGDSLGKSEDLVLLNDLFDKGKVILNLETGVQEIYTSSNSLNTRYSKNQGLLLDIKGLGFGTIFNSSITGAYIGQGELVDEEKLNINYGDFEEQLKDINISVIKTINGNITNSVKVIFTKGDSEQKVITLHPKAINKNGTVAIDIKDAFLGGYFSNDSNYLSISFDLVVNNGRIKSLFNGKNDIYNDKVIISNKNNKKNDEKGPTDFAKTMA